MTQYTEKVHDAAKWWDEHYLTIPKDNLAKRIDFLEHAFAALIDLHAYLAADIESGQAKRYTSLILPGR